MKNLEDDFGLNTFKTENEFRLKTEDFIDTECHCIDVEEDELLDGVHIICKGIRKDEIKKKVKK